MRATIRAVPALVLAALLAGCSTSSNGPDFDNPNDPSAKGSLPAPEDVIVTVGDGRVSLAWSTPVGTPAPAAWAVYRREIVAAGQVDEGQRKIAEVTSAAYLDRQVRNGSVYSYQIAAAETAGGPFGDRSEEATATPALFSIVIESDAEVTNRTSVSAALTGPAGIQAVKLSEDPTLSGAAWQTASSSRTFNLSFGDGMKTVYAVFRLADGSESLPASDSIELDTRAVISSVSFDGSEVKAVGETIHFALDAGEPGGTATVDVTGVFSSLPLFDDGTTGDATAGDGVYERDAVLTSGNTTTGSSVTGRFRDRAGNNAAATDAVRSLTVSEAPPAVTLVDATFPEPPEAAAVILSWTPAPSADFSAYEIHRSPTSPVSTSDTRVGRVTSRNTTTVTDTTAAESATYRYRVFVRTTAGLTAGSNELAVTVPNLRPPKAIDLDEPDGTTTTSIRLSWPRTTDRDFASYRLYRGADGLADDSKTLVGTITDPNVTWLTDTGLTIDTEYAYRLYVVDTGGLSTPGAQIDVSTRSSNP